jgi:hypothetical protein
MTELTKDNVTNLFTKLADKARRQTLEQKKTAQQLLDETPY